MSPPASDGSIFTVVHSIWTGILTLLAGLILWNWNKVNDDIKDLSQEIKSKVDRDDWNSWKVEQQVQHRENRERLDDILKLMVEQKNHGGN